MTNTELNQIADAIKFDKRSMALCIGVPYRTYQNYAYGVNAIPESIARKVLEIKQINITFNNGFVKREDERINHDFPHGIPMKH